MASGIVVGPIGGPYSQWYLDAQANANIKQIKEQQAGAEKLQQINNQAALDQINAQTEAQKQFIELQRQADIAKIQESSKLGYEQLAFAEKKYSDVLAMYQTAFSQGIVGGGTVAIPNEFKQNIDLFAKGGEYGTGLKMEVQSEANKALAAGQMSLASSGMSSGTNAAGLAARIGSDAALANAKIEDQRIGYLSNALTAAGSAGLTAKQLAQQREQAYLGALSSLAS